MAVGFILCAPLRVPTDRAVPACCTKGSLRYARRDVKQDQFQRCQIEHRCSAGRISSGGTPVTECDYTLIFDPRSWTPIPPVPAPPHDRTLGYTLAVPDPSSDLTGERDKSLS